MDARPHTHWTIRKRGRSWFVCTRHDPHPLASFSSWRSAITWLDRRIRYLNGNKETT
jgi:hypothetical protein